MNLKTLILAAGEGTRMLPFTETIPKPLIRLAGKPILEHILLSLKKGGLSDFVIVVGHKKDEIMDHFGDGSQFGAKIEYVLQKRPKGMADAILSAKKLLGDRFILINGDDIFPESIIREALSQKDDIVLGLRKVDDPREYGVCEIDGKGYVKTIEEKPKFPKSNWAVGGIYILKKEILSLFPEVKESDSQFEDALSLFMKKGGKIKSFKIKEDMIFINNPWELVVGNELLLKNIQNKILGEVAETAVIKDGPVFIDKGAKVMEYAIIKGPCYIGKDVIIGNHSLVRGSYIAEGTVVGFGSEIKNSIIMENSDLHHAYVGDSVIGRNCNLGFGTVTANFRFDENPVSVIVKKRRVSSGLPKLGTFMGDNCKTGINVSLMPGVRISNGTYVPPHEIIRYDL